MYVFCVKLLCRMVSGIILNLNYRYYKKNKMDSERDQEYSLCSENYQTILRESITDFYNEKAFTDVTLVCDGEEIKAHQMILAAFSPYFKKLLIGRSESNPIIIFNYVTKEEIVTLLEFIYKGKVNVPRSSLPTLLKTAKKLQIRGINHEISKKNEESVTLLELREETHEQNLEKKPTVNSSNIVKEWVVSVKEEVPQPVFASKNSSGRRSKVINPFAVKERQHENSDSTFCEEDLAKPGPPQKEIYPTSTPLRNDDSDVEIIENNSVLVINESQPVVNDSPEWYRKTQPKHKRRAIRSNQNKASIHFSSDDSDIVCGLPQKRSKNIIYSDEEGVGEREARINPLALKHSNQKLNLSFSDSSSRLASAELIPLAGTSKGVSMPIKDKKNVKRLEKHRERLKMPFHKLGGYCVICKKFQRNNQCHVKQTHKVPPRRKNFSCKECSKVFFFEKILLMHKCKPQL